MRVYIYHVVPVLRRAVPCRAVSCSTNYLLPTQPSTHPKPSTHPTFPTHPTTPLLYSTSKAIPTLHISHSAHFHSKDFRSRDLISILDISHPDTHSRRYPAYPLSPAGLEKGRKEASKQASKHQRATRSLALP